METLNSAWDWAKRDVMSDFGITDGTTGTVATVLSLGVIVGIIVFCVRNRKRMRADFFKGWRGE